MLHAIGGALVIAAVSHALATMRGLRTCSRETALAICRNFSTTPFRLYLPTLLAMRNERRADFMFRLHGRIFADGYSVSDPSDELGEAISRLHHALFPFARDHGDPHPETVTISRADAHLLEAAADTWLHFGAHPASTDSILAQLREVRRFVRKT